jgi:hypothetical protein
MFYTVKEEIDWEEKVWCLELSQWWSWKCRVNRVESTEVNYMTQGKYDSIEKYGSEWTEHLEDQEI